MQYRKYIWGVDKLRRIPVLVLMLKKSSTIKPHTIKGDQCTQCVRPQYPNSLTPRQCQVGTLKIPLPPPPPLKPYAASPRHQPLRCCCTTSPSESLPLPSTTMAAPLLCTAPKPPAAPWWEAP